MKELKTIRDILQALLDGHVVEEKFEPLNKWETVDNICFETQYLDDEVANGKYRIKETKPSIDWSQVSDEYNYLARYRDGFAYLYQRKPRLGLTSWRGSAEGGVSVFAHKSYKPGNCHWEDSLVERPKE